MKMTTSCPSAVSAFGSDPQTSPSPPVLAIGETSEVANTTRMRSRVILRREDAEGPPGDWRSSCHRGRSFAVDAAQDDTVDRLQDTSVDAAHDDTLHRLHDTSI